MGDAILSANVWVLPASGHPVTGTDRITAENIQDFLPDPDAEGRIKRFFRSAGFEVSETVGPTFSIVGEKSTFESAFQCVLEVELEKGIVKSAKTTAGQLVLPLHGLPENILTFVQVVTFDEPPDFGPTDFGF